MILHNLHKYLGFSCIALSRINIGMQTRWFKQRKANWLYFLSKVMQFLLFLLHIITKPPHQKLQLDPFFNFCHSFLLQSMISGSWIWYRWYKWRRHQSLSFRAMTFLCWLMEFICIDINILTIIRFSGITTHNSNSFWTDTFALLAAAKDFHFTLWLQSSSPANIPAVPAKYLKFWIPVIK